MEKPPSCGKDLESDGVLSTSIDLINERSIGPATAATTLFAHRYRLSPDGWFLNLTAKRFGHSRFAELHHYTRTAVFSGVQRILHPEKQRKFSHVVGRF